MALGEKLKAARLSKGLTQEQLATACGLATITIRQYESGKREPKTDTVSRIAEILEIHPAIVDERFGFYLGTDVIVETEDGEYITASMDTREGKMLSRFQALNELGKDEAIKYTDLLLDSNKYRKKPID